MGDEPWVHWLISYNASGREDSFLSEVRNRNRKCVISGIMNPELYVQSGNWTSFEASHILPPESDSYWVQFNYGCCISNMDDRPSLSKINSYQNGFLLESGVHKQFDQYLLSVNPDVGVPPASRFVLYTDR